MTEYPAGTVTFLFTDIEGSTRLWEQYPDQMRRALAAHDEILRGAIERSNGYVFATGGDSFSAAFARALDAANAATEAQEALKGAEWDEARISVRMALHTGEAEERGGDYFGPPLNRVARLLGIAHGGQVLATATTAGLLRPSDLVVADLGRHGLKDLSEPEHVFQVSVTETEFPPLRSLASFPNNLPVQLTSFVGREDQVDELLELVRAHRMLTLTGVGGAGKTRLALQVGSQLIDDFPEGVWFVELAALDDPSLVAQAVIDGIGLSMGGGSPLEQLESYFGTRRSFLILDNCEHLLDAASELVLHLLRVAPHLRVVATSREGLAIEGERTWRVPSMRVAGDPTGAGAPAEALQLFAERATQVDPSFKLSDEATPHVAQICRRLDGMPLAIELAAARTKVLPLEEIARRIDDRFRLLTGGRRTSLERQQTLLATVRWSYDLLSDRERLLFERLGVFRGGFDVEAVEAVGGFGSISDFEVLDLLSELVDKSLLVPERDATGVQRFRMLETLRQFSLDRLIEGGEVDVASQRHADFFLALAERAELLLETAAMAEWLDRLERDHDNLRAALEWLHHAGDRQSAVRLATALSVWFWFLHRHHEEAFEWHDRILSAVDDLPIELLARAYANASMQATRCREGERALEWAELAHRFGEQSGDDRSVITARWTMGDVSLGAYDADAALGHFQESLKRAQQVGDTIWVSRLCMFVCLALDLREHTDEARAFAEQALEAGKKAGWPMGIAEAQGWLADFAMRSGDFAGASALLNESLATEIELGDPWNILGAYQDLAASQRLQGEFEVALATIAKGLDSTAWKTGSWTGCYLMCERAACLLELGDQREAARSVGVAINMATDRSSRFMAASVLMRSATVLAQSDRLTEATTAFAAADRLFEESFSAPPWVAHETESHLENLRTSMKGEHFVESWATGRSLNTEDALQRTANALVALSEG